MAGGTYQGEHVILLLDALQLVLERVHVVFAVAFEHVFARLGRVFNRVLGLAVPVQHLRQTRRQGAEWTSIFGTRQIAQCARHRGHFGAVLVRAFDPDRGHQLGQSAQLCAVSTDCAPSVHLPLDSRPFVPGSARAVNLARAPPC